MTREQRKNRSMIGVVVTIGVLWIAAMALYAGRLWSDSQSVPVDSSKRYVQMLDEESGESLRMQVASDFKHEGKTYALLIPVDSLVYVLAEDSNDELTEVELAQFDTLREHINDALTHRGLRVERRAGEIILIGEQPENFCSGCDSFSTDDDNEDQFLIVAEVKVVNTNYWVAVKVEPDFFPVELIDKGTARPLSAQALERMYSVFQDVILALGQKNE